MKIKRIIAKWKGGPDVVMCEGKVLDECPSLGIARCPSRLENGKWVPSDSDLWEIVHIPSCKVAMPYMGQFPTEKTALKAARRLAPLTDWSRSAEELNADESLFFSMLEKLGEIG